MLARLGQHIEVAGKILVEERLEILTQAAGQGRAGIAGADTQAQMAGVDQGDHAEVGKFSAVVGIDEQIALLGQSKDPDT